MTGKGRLGTLPHVRFAATDATQQMSLLFIVIRHTVAFAQSRSAGAPLKLIDSQSFREPLTIP